VLQLTWKSMFAQEYIMQNKADGDKLLIIEHPYRKEWKLVDSPKLLETTDTWYRFRESIPAGQTRTLKVQEEIIQGETIAILPSDLGQLEFYSRIGEIPQEVRSALVKAMSLKSTMVDTERQIKERQQQLAGITQEQQRIRENMASVSQTSQYYTRLLSKLNDQETAIEKLQGEVEQLKHTYDRQRQELETYLTKTTVG
jgi:chromosome segregation ATPase